MGGSSFDQSSFDSWLAAATGATAVPTSTVPVSPGQVPSTPDYGNLMALYAALDRAPASASQLPATPLVKAMFGTVPPLPPPLKLPGTPSRFTRAYVDKVIERSNRRIDVLNDRVGGITAGRVMPDRDDITIGSGRQFHLAIMFLDICGFSSRPNWSFEEQKNVVALLNVFMAEMLSIVKDFEGTYEKNTGDGLMAYFGENEKSVSDSVKPAVEAALIMHFVNDHLITPWLKTRGVPPMRFRIGIDYGPVTVARVGVHGQESSLVAVGTPANIANKLMNRIPNGGVCIGDEVRLALPHDWGSTCTQCSQDSGFVYLKDGSPYTAWELKHRLSSPWY